MSRELDEILVRLTGLLDEQREQDRAGADEGDDNFRCEGCIECSNCRFCTRCERCEDCTYCEDCVRSIGCTQSRGLLECAGCTHSFESARCEDGSYLGLCYGCVDSVHCFACVGLSGAEFCILNEKYPRSEYFRRVAGLREQIEHRVRAGWRVPWEPKSTEPVAVKREATGTWPPADAESARMLDRGLDDDEDLWAELDELVEGPIGARVLAPATELPELAQHPLTEASPAEPEPRAESEPWDQAVATPAPARWTTSAEAPRAAREPAPFAMAAAEADLRATAAMEPLRVQAAPPKPASNDADGGDEVAPPSRGGGRWGSPDPLPPSRARWTRGDDASRAEDSARPARDDRGWLVAARRPSPKER